jgi:recombination protein RecA
MVISSTRAFAAPAAVSRWTLGDIAGRFIEISSFAGSASLTLVFDLVREAQEQNEPVGWVGSADRFFYPPDAAQYGIDLSALAVVRLPQTASIARAGEKLLRSGGFGIVVLDLGPGDIAMPLQSRLTSLAHHHHSALICLTQKPRAMLSLGSLVSLRAHAHKRRAPKNRFICTLEIVKDKRRGPTWSHELFCSGPAGVC